ncbi:lipid A 1-phosphatase LpxE [Rhizobium sp. BK251]|uniref:lipid A 1-phosphatase LpxE n=1 Tax=Rhizobium sp. BK251 TaxID=2512125 RepID=UPI00104B4535|nr:lipid A 1-phosphatase LpxE [Rhizobium sp. BK251]TCL73050.1 undecaprenyl-diphosphatase [Rhizobium sp. BK251]
MQGILASFDRRRRRVQRDMAPLRWRTCLFVTVNVVLISMMLLDAAVGARDIAAPVHRLGRMLTDFGESGWIICVSAFLFFEGWAACHLLRSVRYRCQAVQISRIGAYLLVSIALSGLLANLLKRVIGRARPQHFEDLGIFGFSPFSNASFQSFPSGHATTIGAFFAALALLFPRYRILFLACALWLGMTRVMVGAHYPSDVAAGLALGGWFSLMIAIVCARLGLLFRTGPDGFPLPRRPLSWT